MNSKNFLKTVKKKVNDFIGSISLKDKPKDKKAIDHNKLRFFHISDRTTSCFFFTIFLWHWKK